MKMSDLTTYQFTFSEAGKGLPDRNTSMNLGPERPSMAAHSPFPASSAELIGGKMSDQRGFTLLEIMVAFTIMALSVAVLLRAFGGSVRLIGDAGEMAKAVTLAQSKLAEVGRIIPVEESEESGEWQQNYHWTLSIQPFEPFQPVADNPRLAMYRVEVTVTWQDGRHQRSYSLSTLRLARKDRL